MDEKYGEYAFIAGVVISLLVGVFATNPMVQPNLGVLMAILAVLGLVVGIMNIRDKEIDSFLIAALVLLASASALASFSAAFTLLGDAVQNAVSGFVGALTSFVAPAAVIVSLKSIYTLASKK